MRRYVALVFAWCSPLLAAATNSSSAIPRRIALVFPEGAEQPALLANRLEWRLEQAATRVAARGPQRVSVSEREPAAAARGLRAGDFDAVVVLGGDRPVILGGADVTAYCVSLGASFAHRSACLIVRSGPGVARDAALIAAFPWRCADSLHRAWPRISWPRPKP
jgi:hypothetical protein